ncbi:CRISPR-associated helicase Cas3' [Candidatus Aerophobetes bacterium]|nr:CRISPR-associated helicase Cas3' [Candidatus Aerophobetes bacterium]
MCRFVYSEVVSISNFYKNYFDISVPYTHQIQVWKTIEKGKYPILLKAPTGSGKTEAVVSPFLSQFIENKFSIAPRLIYVLPMRVLVNSIAARITGYAQKVSKNISVGIQHGESPNAPFFIDDIVVTTLDQFIYGYARASNQVGHHLDIPAGAIASSLIVFDEAHMYRDGFTFSIMRAMFEILHNANIPFVVMTATMPESLEKSLFENIKPEESQKVVSAGFNLDNQLDISIEKEPIYKDNEVNISNALLDKIGNKKTLIVLNQVKRAQEVYKELKRQLDFGNDEIILLHSRFTVKDKKEHENCAIKLLKNKKRGVIVSTQVLEVGMDFSADLLLTELAPADSLVQRAGRCARYKNEKGEIIIFPVEDGKGHLPYEKNHLEKTIGWLEKNKSFNIKDFSEVSKFVDILDYKADDYAARDSLIDLYESVLYADTRPQNIQVREGKSVNLFMVDFAKGEGKKKEEIIRDAVMKTEYKENSITVDIKTAWGLIKKGIPLLEWDWSKEKSEKREKEVAIVPFKTYILESSNYDSEIGVKNDESFII